MERQPDQLIRGYLEPGEELLWFSSQDGPAAGSKLLQGLVMIVPLLIGAVSIAYAVSRLHIPLVAAILAVAVVIAPAILRGPYSVFSIGKRDVYGLTNRRAIVIDRRKTARNRLLPLESLHEIRLSTFPGGNGTITCVSLDRSWPFRDEEGFPIAGPLFRSIRNPVEVRNLLVETRKERLATLPGQGESPDYVGASRFDVTR